MVCMVGIFETSLLLLENLLLLMLVFLFRERWCLFLLGLRVGFFCREILPLLCGLVFLLIRVFQIFFLFLLNYIHDEVILSCLR